MIFGVFRFAPAIVLSFALFAPAGAQNPQQNPVCVRLEAQLASVDQGSVDPARAEQIRRFEEAAARQQSEIDRMSAQSRRQGCESTGFFSLFSGQSAQCGPLNAQIQRMRSNIDSIQNDLQRLRGGSADREGQKRAIVAALGQNDCGPQYRQASTQSRGFFESLFNPNPGPGAGLPPEGGAPSGTHRTVCVRTCDGFYYPISFSASPARFPEDEKVCQRMCPATEVMLFSYPNPGGDIGQAVSVAGKPYSELPNAFQYRKAFKAECSCKKDGETWADALRDVEDLTVERGDVVVTEEQSRALSQPPRLDAQGRPIREARPAAPATNPPAAASTVARPDAVTSEPLPAASQAQPPAAAEQVVPPSGKRTVRSVGPTFLPAR